MEKIKKTEEEWKNELSPEQFDILRKKGTERAFTGALLDNKDIGTYECSACGNPLFTSDLKFDSGCGWPSFYDAISPESIVYKKDTSFGMIRTEALCGKCDGHLGHIFPDGPQPTGQRYCMNSISLSFKKS